MILEMLIRAYRKLPWRLPRCRCRENGPSCSELGLMYAQAVRGLYAWLLVLALAVDCPEAKTDAIPKDMGSAEVKPKAAKGIAKGRARAQQGNSARAAEMTPRERARLAEATRYGVSIHGRCPICKVPIGGGHNRATHLRKGKPA